MAEKCKTIGLLMGSFNPVHLGHLIIAQSVINELLVDEIWFVVSPHNPFKNADDLADENHRLEMVKLGIENNTKFKATDIEFSLPKPNYSYITIQKLIEENPNYNFRLIIGGDNFNNFHLWNEYEYLLNNCPPIVYPRFGIELNPQIDVEKTHILNPPLLDISSTLIREYLNKGLSIKYLVSETVEEYIKEKELFRK